jgi:iron(III) transport system ATP-binding protein
MISVTLHGITKAFPRAGTVIDAVHLRVQPGEFFTLLGPSGCGKSTLLRIVAGFDEPTGGHVLFDDQDVTHEPPNRRGIGFVFQNYALFPHLSVAENVAFGLTVRRLGRREVAERVQAALHDVSLHHCSSERVERLSGGQQQRVALARALVVRPRLLLLDEPLSNLDACLRQDARAVLQRIHAASHATIIYVTHDQTEALAMSDRIAILREGRLHQVASPREIYERPETRFVADFVGRTSIVEAEVCGTADDRPLLRLCDGTEITVPQPRVGRNVNVRVGARVGICLRPESLSMTGGKGTIRGVVDRVEYGGASSVCLVRTAFGTVHVQVARSLACPDPGEHVHMDMNASAVHLMAMEPQS